MDAAQDPLPRGNPGWRACLLLLAVLSGGAFGLAVSFCRRRNRAVREGSRATQRLPNASRMRRAPTAAGTAPASTSRSNSSRMAATAGCV